MNRDVLFSFPCKSVDKYKMWSRRLIDIASWYKEVEPLKTKKTEEVVLALQKMYERSPFNFSEYLKAGKRYEFMGPVTTWQKATSLGR